MEPAQPSAGRVGLRSLRPFIAWIVLSAALFACQYHLYQLHHATIRFTVSIEGRSKIGTHWAMLNDVPFENGRPTGLGERKLTIQAEDAEPFSTNVSVGYGGIDLGHITLQRIRGTLDLNVSPKSDLVSVSGTEMSKALTDVTHKDVSLATGHYLIEAHFTRFSTQEEVTILPHKVQRVSIDPGIVALQLTSEPTNLMFTLDSSQRSNISIRSNTPVLLTDMPAGEYTLKIWTDDYRKTVPLRLDAAQHTNEISINFDYAQLTVTSDPSGAEVWERNNRLGLTPLTIRRRPDSYEFTITNDGFRGTNFTLALSGNETQTVAVVLPNLAFIQAMENARAELLSRTPDFTRGLAEVEKALKIKPADSDALRVKRTLLFTQHLIAARDFERNGEAAAALAQIDDALKLNPSEPASLAIKERLERAKAEADERRAQEEKEKAEAKASARLAHPQRVLQNISNRIRYAELFQTETMHAGGAVDDVLAKVQRALKHKPEWAFIPSKSDADTAIIEGDLNSIGTKRHLVMVLGQTSDADVSICFKLIQRVLDSKVQLNLSGITDDSYVPLHPQYISNGLRSPEREQAAAVQALKQRIQDELR